jgi:dihydropteroate synthase
MIYRISSETDIRDVFDFIEVDKIGSKIMAKKANLNRFFIKDIDVKAANILKQDALSIGAELACSKHCADFSKPTTNALLICNNKQLEILVKKESIQPFGLKKISSKLSLFVEKIDFKPQIMGVLNINSDSFFVQSRVGQSSFLDSVHKMIDDGADIIDVGGVSSRPGSTYPGEAEELLRVEPIFELIYKNKLYEKASFSADTFSPKVACAALESGFKIINDINGLKDDELARVIAQYSATVVMMHKKGDTKTMQENPKYDNTMLEIDSFFDERVEKAKSFGVSDIVLDVGIGFGKSLDDNLTVIKNLGSFMHFGLPLLIGASRKSMINDISPSIVEDRLAGTLSIHQKALDNGASIIRAHDVKEHRQMIEVWKKIRSAM